MTVFCRLFCSRGRCCEFLERLNPRCDGSEQSQTAACCPWDVLVPRFCHYYLMMPTSDGNRFVPAMSMIIYVLTSSAAHTLSGKCETTNQHSPDFSANASGAVRGAAPSDAGASPRSGERLPQARTNTTRQRVVVTELSDYRHALNGVQGWGTTRSSLAGRGLVYKVKYTLRYQA